MGSGMETGMEMGGGMDVPAPPTSLKPNEVATAQTLAERGLPPAQIAEILGVDQKVIKEVLEPGPAELGGMGGMRAGNAATNAEPKRSMGSMPMGGMGGMQGSMKEPDPDSNKELLNTICMKITKAALKPGDILYDTEEVTTGFQCTVTVPILGGNYLTTSFVGDVSDDQEEAEESA